ncbi:MAG: hypothetical protein ACRDH2_01945 [Anaerolineales bacterium]
MTAPRRWFKALLGGGVLLMALALAIGLLTPFIFMMAGPGALGSTGMSGMMGCGWMMDGALGWLWALPLLLFALGILLLAGAVIVWLAQAPIMRGPSIPAPPAATTE